MGHRNYAREQHKEFSWRDLFTFHLSVFSCCCYYAAAAVASASACDVVGNGNGGHAPLAVASRPSIIHNLPMIIISIPCRLQSSHTMHTALRDGSQKN